MVNEILTSKHVKLQNKQSILALIREAGVTSRVEISKKTGLAKCCVSTLVSELINEDAIKEIGEGEASDKGGRKPRLLTPVIIREYCVGIDFSKESRIIGVLCNDSGEVLANEERPQSNDCIIACESMTNMVQILCQSAPGCRIIGVGIGITGTVNIRNNVIMESNYFDTKDKEFNKKISKNLNLPVVIENEANAAALAEKKNCTSSKNDSLLYISIGKRIKAGLILKNEIYYGDNFVTGELGHIVVDEQGALCDCGVRGCFAAEDSYPALIKKVRGISRHNVNSIDDIANLYKSKDAMIGKIIYTSAVHLGKIIALSYNMLNINQVRVGGISIFGDEYLDIVKKTLIKYTNNPRPEDVNIKYATLGDNAVAVGAAAALFTRLQILSVDDHL